MIDGAIVRSVGVGFGAGAFEDGIPLFGGEMFAAAEHHMLEEMRKTASPRLHLVPGTGLNDQVERHQTRMVGGHGDQSQPIRKVIEGVRVREKPGGYGWNPTRQQDQPSQSMPGASFHE